MKNKNLKILGAVAELCSRSIDKYLKEDIAFSDRKIITNLKTTSKYLKNVFLRSMDLHQQVVLPADIKAAQNRLEAIHFKRPEVDEISCVPEEQFDWYLIMSLSHEYFNESLERMKDIPKILKTLLKSADSRLNRFLKFVENEK